ncbi:MAG: O-antigen ligase family protein, partial [bacterium]|nr:O-antigen ligase family protein [bacterium]
DFQAEVNALADEMLAEAESTAESPTDAAALEDGQISNIDYPRGISLFANHTLASTAVLGSCLAMLVAGTLLFTENHWKIGLLITLTVVGLSNALVGLLQSVAWNKWTLLPMSGSFFSTFINRNSVAQYYSIALGAALALMVWWHGRFSGGNLDKRYHVRYPAVNILARLRRRVETLLTDLDAASIVLLIVMTLLLASVLAAASRGGIVACVFAVLVSTTKLLGNKGSSGRVALGLVVGAILTSLFLSWYELDKQMLARLSTMSEELHELSNVRVAIWMQALSESQYWVLGSGFGTFHLAVLTCQIADLPLWVYHAENIFVETWVTLGIFGFATVVFGLSWLLWQLLFSRGHQNSALRIATLLPVVAIGTQSMTDFSVMLPAIFLPLSILVGAVCGEFQSNPRPSANGGETENEFEAMKRRSSRRRRRSSDQHASSSSRSSSASQTDTESKQHAPTSKQGNPLERRWKPFITSALQLGMIALAAYLGLPKLLDFGKAEAMAQRAEYRNTLTINTEFEIARQQQQQFSQAMLQLDWPADVSDIELAQLSRPEVIVAASRSSDERFQALMSLLDQDPRLLPLLKSTSTAMLETVALCPQDWRGTWGLLRSDLSVLDRQERFRNTARLLITGKHKPSLLGDLGTHWIWSGEKQLGLICWREALSLDARWIRSLPTLASELLSLEDLLYVLPEDPLTRASVAQQFTRTPELQSTADSLIAYLDLGSAAEQADTANQWKLVNWLASQKGDLDMQLVALKEVARRQPMDHRTSYDLAGILLKLEQPQEALDEIRRALRRSPDNRSYQQLEQQILQSGPSPP